MVHQSCDLGSMPGMPILKCLSSSLFGFKIKELLVFLLTCNYSNCFLQSLEINHYYSILAVGDFNFPNIQWVEGSGFAYSSSGEEAGFTSLLLD